MNTSSKVIVSLNILTYRIDGMMSNLADCFMILTFALFFYNSLGLTRVIFLNTLSGVLLISILIHFMYAPVYMINDLIDYDQMMRFDWPKRAFYEYRPVVYFNKRKALLSAMCVWYSGVVYLVASLLEERLLVVLMFAVAFALLSLVRSVVGRRSKLVLFGVLRSLKYMCSIVLLNVVLFDVIYRDATGVIIVGMIFPYVLFNVASYSGFTQRLLTATKHHKSKVGLVVLIVSFIVVLMAALRIGSQSGIFEATWIVVVGQVLVTIPGILLARYLPFLTVGTGDGFASHLLRWAMKLVITTIWCMIVIITTC